MATTEHALPSLLVFGSQTTLPSTQYLNQLRAFILLDRRLYPLLTAIRQLPKLWEALISFDARLEQTPSASSLHALDLWLERGEAFRCTGVPPNLLAAPLTVIFHLVQYLHYLDSNSIGVTHRALLDSLQHGGIQGCCTGVLSAIMVACSKSEEDVVLFACKALSLAVCIGAYVDLDKVISVPSKASICLVVRWKQAPGRGILEETLRSYPEAYISLLSDSNTVTVTCLKTDADTLISNLNQQGMTVKRIGLEGRFHSPALNPFLIKLIEFCRSNEDLHLPLADELLVSVRSNTDAQIIKQGPLHEAALKSILTEIADWHLTLRSTCYQSGLVGRHGASAVSIGLVDSIPHALAVELGLKVIRLRDSALLLNDHTRPEPFQLKPPQSDMSADSHPQIGPYSDSAIAVIGMACRFPGADSTDEFWEQLIFGASMHSEVPAERFSTRDHRRSHGKTYFGNFIRDIDAFDHRFFKKSSREAASTDPQQRLLLQVAYEALESSGEFGGLSRPCEETGCYVGVCGNDYNDNVASHDPNAFSTLGTLRAFLTGKISHYFGWSGPSITFDTACSSSAVAIHAACKALQGGECTRAVAGGVSLFTSPYFYQNLAAASFLSSTGPCKSFDAAADGYCRGEGVGLVVMKKLSAAIVDRDDILGVISATAVSQCSNTVPITVPHSPSQTNLFKKLLTMAHIKHTDVSFVEAHGTGTPVGDPLEFESIKDVFGAAPRSNKLHVGSVKANIGHTEGASGVAALIKAILMMKHKTIPPQANFKTLSSKISALNPGNVVVPVTPQKWESDKRIVCVNNYGAAGSISAMIVCQPPPDTKVAGSSNLAQPKYPIIVSAKSPASLRAYCVALRERISNHTLTSSSKQLLADVSFALAEKQNQSFPYKLATSATTLGELDGELQSMQTVTDMAPTVVTPKPAILAFGGQTSRFIGLSQNIYHSSYLLRMHLDHCDTIVRSLGYEGLYPGIFSAEPQENIISLHAMYFALQYSCAMAWMDCGLKIDRLVGHSFGQLTALTISGSLSLVDGLKLVCGRASLMQQKWGPESGTMMVIEEDLATVSKLTSAIQSSGHNIEIACYNSPQSHVLVGTQRGIEAVEQYIAQSATFQKTKAKILKVTHGFHSEFTEPILPGLLDLAEGLTFKEMTIPLETCSDQLSWTNVEANLIAEHTRGPVYFGQAVDRIARRLGPCTWVEAGSNSSITNMVRRALSLESGTQHSFHTVHLCKNDGMGSLADTTVDLWKSGSRVQFWPFHRLQKSAYEYFDLPPYQFEKPRHWLQWAEHAREPPTEPATPVEEKEEPKLLSFVRFRDHTRKEADFYVDPRSEQYRLFVQGHRVLAQPLFPAPLYIELVAQAALKIETALNTDDVVASVEDLEIKAPLGSNQGLEIHLLLTRLEDTDLKWYFNFSSPVPNGDSLDSKGPKNFQEHATGTVILRSSSNTEIRNEFDRFQRLVGSSRYHDMMANQDAEAMQGSLIYKVFSKVVHYSGYYEGVRRVSSKGGEVSGLVALPEHELDALNETICNPLAIDNFIQVAGLHVNSLNSLGDNEVFVCTHVDRIQPSSQFVGTPPNDRSWLVFSNYTPNSQKEVTNDIFVFDATSQKLVFIVLGARFQKVVISSLAKVLSRANSAVNLAETRSAKGVVSIDKLRAPGFKPSVGTAVKVREPKTSRDPTGEKKLKDSRNTVVSDIEKALRNLLSKITDVPVDAFKNDSTMEDLGIDSLMVMEITTEIQQAFGIDIPQTDLQNLTTFGGTLDYICMKQGIHLTGTPPNIEEAGDQAASNGYIETSSDHVPEGKSARSQNGAITKLAELLASHLETSPSSFTSNTNLAEQGLDSLLCMELSTDITESLGVTVDIAQLTTESTFGDLCDLVVESGSTTLTPSSAESGSSEATTAPGSPPLALEKSLQPDKLEAQNTLSGAQQAFDAIKYEYDTFTRETGFFDFWKLVYPSQAKLVVAYVLEAFSHLGCSLHTLQSGDYIPEIKMLPRHEKLGSVLHDILRDASLIEWTGNNFIRSEILIDTTSANELHQKILLDHPKNASEHNLLHITGSKLGQLLSGTADPLQLLFGSKKNRDLLEDVYTNGPMYEAITRLLGSFLGKVFNAGQTGQTFHFLELGGGTGSTTKHVLEILSRSGISFTYTFTDLSAQLVAAGKRKFAKYNFMKFMALDIEKSPPAELLGHFHVILSTNCIHATRNLESSLSNIRRMLRNDGFMSLVEFTINIFWFDLVFGLLEGWWLFEDGRKHVLADAAFWEKTMKAAGFKHITMTDGTNKESRTLRIITGFPAACEDPAYRMAKIPSKSDMPIETLAYKVTRDNILRADLYYPENENPKTKRPIALMIHGGGHVMLSRKDVRLKQIKLLLQQGLLPVSIDYRLCPEVNILEGPMTDVCDALRWAREQLPSSTLKHTGIKIDGSQVVVIGWSTGGHLATSLAWTAPLRKVRPPEAILAFYCPLDYEDDCWKTPNFPGNSASYASQDGNLLEGVQEKPVCPPLTSVYPDHRKLTTPQITGYNIPPNQRASAGWMSPSDPRSRIILHMNWKGQALPVLLNGLPSKASGTKTVEQYSSMPQPTLDRIQEISPYAQVLKGNYKTPTYFIHGTKDDLIPWQQAQRMNDSLKERGVEVGISVLEGVEHLFDLVGGIDGEMARAVTEGYEFLFRRLRLED